MINDFPLTDIERRGKRNETTSEIAAMKKEKHGRGKCCGRGQSNAKVRGGCIDMARASSH